MKVGDKRVFLVDLTWTCHWNQKRVQVISWDEDSNSARKPIAYHVCPPGPDSVKSGELFIGKLVKVTTRLSINHLTVYEWEPVKKKGEVPHE